MTRRMAARERVTRADGRTINVARRRGHLSYCFHGCCCGRTDKGYPAAPADVYKEEWVRRRLRNTLHLTKGAAWGRARWRTWRTWCSTGMTCGSTR
ncbi:hypothetical protein ACFQDE_17590 [Deinococcus caeni]|uniref:hypothetical protein n=1 Tax=Deinococcus caeni TaxID=569127 RepID=UPI003609D5FE